MPIMSGNYFEIWKGSVLILVKLRYSTIFNINSISMHLIVFRLFEIKTSFFTLPLCNFECCGYVFVFLKG